MFDSEPIHTTPWLLCRQCRYEFKADSRTFRDYFQGGVRECPGCRRAVDWWEEVVHALIEFFGLGRAIELAGAQAVSATILLNPGEVKLVDLTEAGIPPEARILYLNLTTNGSGAWPLLVHGNDVLHRTVGPRFHVYGRPFHESSGSPKVAVWAVWFRPEDGEVVLPHLMDASREYSDGRFDRLVVPANIAVESALSPLLGRFVEEFAAKDEARRFLRDGATYSHQLNVLLPMLAAFRKLPKMPEGVRTRLNRLRRLRNEIAHSGACQTMTRPDAAELLAAGIFGVRYVEFLRLSPGS